MANSGTRRLVAQTAVGVAFLVMLVLTIRFLDDSGRTPPASPPPAAPRPAPSAPPPADAPAATPEPAPSPAAEPAPPPPASAHAPPAAQGTTLTLSIEVVDAAGVRVRSGTLHVRPSLDLLGRREDGRSLVRLLRPQELAAANPLVAEGIPASFAGGTVSVLARVPGCPPDEERSVTLAASGTTEVRLVVTPARSLEVQVVDAAAGAPVAGARVISATELERREIEPSGLTGERGPGWATTDAEGRALLTDLGRGLHDLEVAAEGWKPLTPRRVDPGPTPLVVRMERVREGATLRAIVKGPDGAPVPDVHVELRLLSRDSKDIRTTDARGVAEFEGLPAGHAIVSVDLIQWIELSEKRGWPQGNVSELNDPIEIATGARQEIVLGFRGGTASVACTVVDGAGAPVEDVKVTISGGSWMNKTTDPNGTVEFTGIAAGKFSISIERKGDWLESGERTLEDGARQELRFVIGDRTVRGRVLGHGAEPKPIAEAYVAVAGDRYMSLKSDASGAFAAEEALPGAYEVYAVADGWAPGKAEVVVEAGKDPAPVEIVLRRGGHIRFWFRKAPGAEIPEGALRVRDPAGEAVEVTRDETGAFFRETHRLPPGAYAVEFDAPGGGVRTWSIEIPDGKDVTVDLGE